MRAITIVLSATLLAMLASLASRADEVAEPQPVPGGLSLSETRVLSERYQALVATAKQIRERRQAHDGPCSAVPETDHARRAGCGAEKASIEAAWRQYNGNLAAYHRDRAKALKAAYDVDESKIVSGLLAYARKKNLDDKEVARIEAAFDEYGLRGEAKTKADVAKAWAAVKARQGDPTLAQKLAAGVGPHLVWSGTQTRYQDCTIFALANAANVPYGYVAGLAGEIIRQGRYRSAAARLQPQTVIEARGLAAGEVIVLAEVLGQVGVVERSAFAERLARSQAVLVAVWPEKGRGSHQVVLNKTFTHEGKTWFGLIDSNIGQMILREDELALLLQDTGIVYTRDPKRTVRPLR